MHMLATAPQNTAADLPNYVRTADGTALFYRDWGAGRPLVFMSGWTLSSEMWSYQMEPLSRRGFRCIAFDRRGHGRSSDPGQGYDFDTLADDLATLLEALDVEDATLVAHSFASGEAVRYLTRHGTGRVGRVLLLAPAAIPFLARTDDNPDGLDPALFEGLRQAYHADFPGWAESGAEAYFTPGTSRGAVDWTLQMMFRASHQALMELSRIQTSTDFRAELQALDVPVLIVHGDRDASAPLELTGKPAAALIPHARLLVYEGAPHGLYFTHKDRLNADLEAFALGEHG